MIFFSIGGNFLISFRNNGRAVRRGIANPIRQVRFLFVPRTKASAERQAELGYSERVSRFRAAIRFKLLSVRPRLSERKVK